MNIIWSNEFLVLHFESHFSILQNKCTNKNKTYGSIWFMRFYDLDRLAISYEYCLRITEPSCIKSFSSDKGTNGCRSTAVTL